MVYSGPPSFTSPFIHFPTTPTSNFALVEALPRLRIRTILGSRVLLVQWRSTSGKARLWSPWASGTLRMRPGTILEPSSDSPRAMAWPTPLRCGGGGGRGRGRGPGRGAAGGGDQAARSLRDRAPAVGAVVAGLAGPLAWIPGVMVVNEVIMKRTDQYGALPKSGGPSGFDLGKAVMRHHILRMLYDAPRVVDVEKFYNVKDGLSLVELQASIDDGTLDECVTGRFEP
ncbi:unnamed protein product [Prorocentrum cordatum]|uniref:Uncharacterized protein n=1 Tax=Prorocentrum cordatum TaxID=2364126 RepID=A0ABN9X6Y5_9DINO|nr:unnamed protein product [Polarella glacialis]